MLPLRSPTLVCQQHQEFPSGVLSWLFQCCSISAFKRELMFQTWHGRILKVASWVILTPSELRWTCPVSRHLHSRIPNWVFFNDGLKKNLRRAASELLKVNGSNKTWNSSRFKKQKMSFQQIILKMIKKIFDRFANKLITLLAKKLKQRVLFYLSYTETGY